METLIAPGPLKTARLAVVNELRRRGAARNKEIAEALGLKPGTVGYILYRLRIEGHARRVKMGHYEFLSVPESLKVWEQVPQAGAVELKAAPGGTMPQRILSLLDGAPGKTLGFRAIWKLTGLKRQIVGAVLSDLARRGLLERLHRGIYRLPAAPQPDAKLEPALSA